MPDLPGAACADVDSDVFFPDVNGGVNWHVRMRAALEAPFAFCASCPLHVREACWDLAVSTGTKDGVWGGRFLLRGKVRADLLNPPKPLPSRTPSRSPRPAALTVVPS